MTPELVEGWKVIDGWWKPEDEWIVREFADVRWGERAVVMVREGDDPVWRVHRARK